MMHSPDTFLNILLNLIFLIAVRSTHNAFAIDRSIAIDVMGTSALDGLARANGVQWYEHVLKRGNGDILQRALDFEVAARRGRG